MLLIADGAETSVVDGGNTGSYEPYLAEQCAKSCIAYNPLNVVDHTGPWSIPLPPSGPASEYGDDIQMAGLLGDPCNVPLPRTADGSLYGESLDDQTSGLPNPLGGTTLQEGARSEFVEHSATDVHTQSLDEDASSSTGGDTASRHLLGADGIPDFVSEEYAFSAKCLPEPLLELIEAIQTEDYNSQLCDNFRAQFSFLLRTCDDQRRLLRRLPLLQISMVQSLRNSQRTSFAKAYAEAVDLLQDHSAIEDGQTPAKSNLYAVCLPRLRLSIGVEKDLEDIIHRCRRDSSFLAERISSLPPDQLSSIGLEARRPHIPGQTVQEALNNQNLGLFNFGVQPRSTDVTNLTSGNLLHTLLFTIFDSSCRPGSREYHLRNDCWSSILCRLILDGKAGVEPFISGVLDLLAHSQPWPLSAQIELFLLRFLQVGQGHFDSDANLAPSPSSPQLGTAPGVTAYLDSALESLVHLLSSLPLTSIPGPVLHLIQATMLKVSAPEKRKSALDLFTAWYYTSFISEAIISPEMHGLLLNYHLKPAVRKHFLGELSRRFRMIFSDRIQSSKSTPSSPVLRAGLDILRNSFISLGSDASFTPTFPTTGVDRIHISLNTTEVSGLIDLLRPRYAPPEESNPTKTSYVSLSTIVSGLDDSRTGTVSSQAPSDGGTSMTSEDTSFIFATNSHSKIGGMSPTVPVDRTQEATRVDGIAQSEVSYSHSLADEIIRISSSEPPHSSNIIASFFLSGDVISSRPENLEPSGEASAETTPREQASDTYSLIEKSIVKLSRNNTLHCGMAVPIGTTTNLSSTFVALSERCASGFDSLAAIYWSRAAEASSNLSETDRISMLFAMLEVRQRRSQQLYDSAQQLEEWIRVLTGLSKRQAQALEQRTSQLGSLRDKGWYEMDVRHSSHFEDVLRVSRALKEMSRSSLPAQNGVTAWARARLRSWHDRAQSQTFELLAVPQAQGGPNKLTDAQTDLTSRWLIENSIENLCAGEERLHRFCFEVQKCVKKLVANTLLESPVLWSSDLYLQEQRKYGARTPSVLNKSTRFSLPSNSSVAYNASSTYVATGLGLRIYDTTSKTNPHLGRYGSNLAKLNTGSRGGLGVSAPTFGQHQLHHSPPTPISPELGIDLDQETLDAYHSPKQIFIRGLKQALTSLLLSDLALDVWSCGSETDQWIRAEGDFYDSGPPTLNGNRDDTASTELKSPTASEFTTVTAIKVAGPQEQLPIPPSTTAQDSSYSSNVLYSSLTQAMLETFEFYPNPFAKLDALTNAILVIAETPEKSSIATDETVTLSSLSKLHGAHVARTRLTRLEEVMANCDERRVASLAAWDLQSAAERHSNTSRQALVKVRDEGWLFSTVQILLSNRTQRSRHIYLDLQLIAALVPANVLDNTLSGTIFWTTCIAATALKSKICKSMTLFASQILAHHYGNGGAKEPIRCNESAATRQLDLSVLSSKNVLNSTLADAARLYTIGALEGDSTSARELALFYLSHPELVRRVTLPLSKPSDVFKPSFALGPGEKSFGWKRQEVLDPSVFALALHWMEFAANGGDVDARTFLKENGDLG